MLLTIFFHVTFMLPHIHFSSGFEAKAASLIFSCRPGGQNLKYRQEAVAVTLAIHSWSPHSRLAFHKLWVCFFDYRCLFLGQLEK